MPVKWKELHEASQSVSADGAGPEVFLCRETGRIYWRTDLDEDLEELPDDIEDDEKYLELPSPNALGLGKPLALEFTRLFLADGFDDVREIFMRKGAFSRFKNFLERRDALDAWYDFEAKAQEAALREWCDHNEIEVIDD
ncbi:hypothetical protein [Methylosinus sp. LW4]|uniref:hypothetical protein n=1 Tax=Methylosinus sp. LW4 TaxID=136993 RepID=UPI00037FCE6E|nr:hypothetical protein [Methylosinus sp. LW4]